MSMDVSGLDGLLGRMHPQHAKVFKAIAEAQEDRRGGWRVRRIEAPQSWVITAFRNGLFRAALAKLFSAPFGYKAVSTSGKMGTYEVYIKVECRWCGRLATQGNMCDVCRIRFAQYLLGSGLVKA